MKSLFLGIFGDSGSKVFDSTVDLFRYGGERTINSYRFNNFVLHCCDGCTAVSIHENENYFLALAGDSFPEIVSEEYIDSDPAGFLKRILKKLTDNFTICLYDKRSGKLFVANDFFGLYPLFYCKAGNNTLFCNEYQPLLLQGNEKAAISEENISQFFEYGFTLDGVTFLDNINKLPERHMLEISPGVLTAAEYEEFRITPQEKSYDQYVDELYQALSQSVKNCFDKLSQPVVTLSGGLDTRMILALTDKTIRQKLQYLTFYLSPLNEDNDKDVLIAKILAGKYGLTHSITAFEEKTKDLDKYYFHDIRNHDRSCVLTGQYGGELLSGILYQNVLTQEMNELLKKLFIPGKFTLHDFFNHSSLKRVVKGESRKHFYFKVLTSSFFTSIYGGSEGLWVHPWADFLRYFSPFTDREFLKVWFSIPDQYLFEKGPVLYFDLYTRYMNEYKQVPTNSFLPGLAENGFQYFNEGIEQKAVKRNKSVHLTERIHEFSGFQLVPERFRSNAYFSCSNRRQRVIDFCVWFDYYLMCTHQVRPGL